MDYEYTGRQARSPDKRIRAYYDPQPFSRAGMTSTGVQTDGQAVTPKSRPNRTAGMTSTGVQTDGQAPKSRPNRTAALARLAEAERERDALTTQLMGQRTLAAANAQKSEFLIRKARQAAAEAHSEHELKHSIAAIVQDAVRKQRDAARANAEAALQRLADTSGDRNAARKAAEDALARLAEAEKNRDALKEQLTTRAPPPPPRGDRPPGRPPAPPPAPPQAPPRSPILLKRGPAKARGKAPAKEPMGVGDLATHLKNSAKFRNLRARADAQAHQTIGEEPEANSKATKVAMMLYDTIRSLGVQKDPATGQWKVVKPPAVWIPLPGGSVRAANYANAVPPDYENLLRSPGVQRKLQQLKTSLQNIQAAFAAAGVPLRRS